MTVGELIEVLATFPRNSTVYVEINEDITTLRYEAVTVNRGSGVGPIISSGE